MILTACFLAICGKIYAGGHAIASSGAVYIDASMFNDHVQVRRLISAHYWPSFDNHISQSMIDSGQIDPSQAADALQAAQDLAANEKDLESETGVVFKVSKRHCSRCKQTGHNKRTCKA